MGMLIGRYQVGQDYPQGSRAERIGSIYAERISDLAIRQGNLLIPLAQKRNMSPAQLALLWVKDQPGVTAPVIGPRTLAHLEDALGIMDKSLDAGTADELDRLYPPGSASANFHNTSGWMKQKI
jgi:aryl-alcohol dehydrogenase-like predicted oxidoreductase